MKAVLWDVDGTMAETERDAHRVAFNQAFEAHALPWRWSVEHYGTLLSVAGGRERFLFDLSTRADAPRDVAVREALAREVHATKNRLYAEVVGTVGIALRPGVHAMLMECIERGIAMAITTTTSTTNVDVLLRRHLGSDWARHFAAIVCGEQVSRKKPDPEVYERALQLLTLSPAVCVALEDSPAGVESAVRAHVPVVVTRSVYFAEVDVPAAIAIGPGLHTRHGWTPSLDTPSAMPPDARVTLDDLARWCELARKR